MQEQRLDQIPDRASMEDVYKANRSSYTAALSSLQATVAEALRGAGIRPTLKGRIKEFDSYYSKKLRLMRKALSTHSSLPSVHDIIAVRAVCPFLGDLQIAERVLGSVFEVVEVERKGAERSFREFGYESIHVLARLPAPLAASCQGLEDDIFEIQLRTILQEAWAEVEHELVYKAEFTPFDEPMKRKLAALNANLTLSDIIFQELVEYEKRLHGELAKRRSAFYERVEAVADAPEAVASAPEAVADAPEAVASAPRASAANAGDPAAPTDPADLADAADAADAMDEADDFFIDTAMEAAAASSIKVPLIQTQDMDSLLLAALEAHNKADYARAVALYGRILDQNPSREAAAVVYKHRGMAFFATSRYKEAADDFSACLALDPECYKAAYYRGVVKSVEQDYTGAIEDFSLALQIHPYHFYSRYRRALVWWRLGDSAQALSDCETALHIKPDSALVLHLRDSIRKKLGGDDF